MAQRIIQNIVGGTHRHEIERVSRSFTSNMYPETVEADQSTTNKVLLGIKGTSLALHMQDGPCRGLYRASRGNDGNPVLFGAWGSSVYVIRETSNGFVKRRIGQVSNALAEPVHFAETGGEGSAHPHLVVVDGASVFAVDTTLSDSYMAQDWRSIPLPTRVGDETHTQKIQPSHVAYLYGYLIINDVGSDAFYMSIQYPFESTDEHDNIIYDVFCSDLNGAYGGYGFVTYSEWNPDNTVALCSNGSYLYTFGPRSVQCFSYRDDINRPFVSPDNAAESIGIRAPHSLATCGPYTAWLASSDVGQNGIYIMEGNQKQRVSTISIERQISKMKFPEDAVGQFWEENQHLFYAITFRTDKVTLVYDLTEKEWHARESYEHGVWRPQYATFAYNKIFFGELNSDALVYLDNDKYTEWDGLCIVRLRRGGAVYSDNSPFFCDALHITLNNGQIDNPTLDPRVMMRYSTDGNDWTDKEVGSMGGIGRYDHQTCWWNLGLCRYLTVEISCSDPVDFAIVSAKINASPCNIF
ncbi:hypothetical protein [Fibrobacter sp.]|uniref:hypothetical protein n=1 Tax=Fibrobacter sp. TaxID=35828 RepID=UPI00388F1BB1